MASIKPTTVPSKRLATSITASDYSFKLNNIVGWSGDDLTSADFGSKLYCVFRDSAGTVMELMELDPTTITSASAAITILQRGLAFNGGYSSEVSANKLSWVKGDTIVELGSHVPQLLAHYVDVLADQVVAGVKTFASTPASTGGNPINPTDLAIKSYVDGLVLGTLTTLDVLVPGIADATIAAGQIVYLKTSNGRWALASAASGTTSENVLLGIAQGAGTSGNSISGGILLQGSDANQSGLTTGNLQYLSDTPGAMSTSHGTKTVVLGIAKDTTHVNFVPRFDQELTQDQIDAMAGTSGTPSGTNKFVTNNDTSGTGSVVRASLIAGINFGDGSDGAVVFDGSTTILGLAPSTSVYTLTRDIYCTDITVNNGVTIKTANYRIYATGTLTVTGTIDNSGLPGGNGTNGATSTSGSTTGPAGGAAAAATAAGSLPANIAGVAGSKGGDASNGGGTGGAGGGSGASGGLLAIYAYAIVISASGIISAKGGKGGNGGSGGAAGTSFGSASGAAGTQGVNGNNSSPSIGVSAAAYNAAQGKGGNGGANASPSVTSGSGATSGSTVGVATASKTLPHSAIGAQTLYEMVTMTAVKSSAGAPSGGGGGSGGASSSSPFPTTDGGGGGGGYGGTGGVIILLYHTLTNNGSITVAGGVKGTGGAAGGSSGSTPATAGTDGVDGATGVIFSLAL